jgi:hypothetical protein
MYERIGRHLVLFGLTVTAAGCTTEPRSAALQGTSFELRSFSGAPLPLRYSEQDSVTYYELVGDILVFDGADSLTRTTIVRRVAAALALDTLLVGRGRVAYWVVGDRLTVSHSCCPPMDQMCGGPPCPAVDVGPFDSDVITLYRDWDVRRPTLRYTRSTNRLQTALPDQRMEPPARAPSERLGMTGHSVWLAASVRRAAAHA